MEKENAPPSSRPKLSLSLKRRFAALEREEVDQYSIAKVPKRTEQSNNWAASNFEEWRRDYNGRNPGSEIRRDILGSVDCEELDPVYVHSRNSKGERGEISSAYALPASLRTTSLRFATSPGCGFASVLF